MNLADLKLWEDHNDTQYIKSYDHITKYTNTIPIWTLDTRYMIEDMRSHTELMIASFNNINAHTFCCI